MYNGLLAFRLKTGDLADQILGLGLSFQQMDHMAVDSTSGQNPAFKAMVLAAWVGFDYDTFTVSETPADAVSVTIEDPSTVECLGDADLFINQGTALGNPYDGLLAYQYKTGDNAELVLGFGSFAKQMQHTAINTTSGTEPQFKAMLLVSWVGYDYNTQTVSPTPAEQVSVTIEDPESLKCHGDAATFIGVGGGGGGGVTPETGSFTTTFSGGIGSVTIDYYKLGNLVSLVFPLAVVADPGAATFTFDSNAADMPSAIRPTQTRAQAGVVRDNANSAPGEFTIASNGLIQVGLVPQAPFTDDAQAGWANQTITYLTAAV